MAAQIDRAMVGSICDHEAEAEVASALLGVRCWSSSVMRVAISLLSVARSPLRADEALSSSGPAGAPAVVWEAYRILLLGPSLIIRLAI
ncbi:MAG: hypothetical protein ACXWNE_04665 [Candidatus Binataceae bacterium]